MQGGCLTATLMTLALLGACRLPEQPSSDDSRLSTRVSHTCKGVVVTMADRRFCLSRPERGTALDLFLTVQALPGLSISTYEAVRVYRLDQASPVYFPFWSGLDKKARRLLRTVPASSVKAISLIPSPRTGPIRNESVIYVLSSDARILGVYGYEGGQRYLEELLRRPSGVAKVIALAPQSDDCVYEVTWLSGLSRGQVTPYSALADLSGFDRNERQLVGLLGEVANPGWYEGHKGERGCVIQAPHPLRTTFPGIALGYSKKEHCVAVVTLIWSDSEAELVWIKTARDACVPTDDCPTLLFFPPRIRDCKVWWSGAISAKSGGFDK